MGAVWCKSRHPPRTANRKRKAVDQGEREQKKNVVKRLERLAFERNIHTIQLIGAVSQSRHISNELCEELVRKMSGKDCLIDLDFRADCFPFDLKSVAEWIMREMCSPYSYYRQQCSSENIDNLAQQLTRQFRTGTVQIKKVWGTELIFPEEPTTGSERKSVYFTEMVLAALTCACSQDTLSKELYALAANAWSEHTIESQERLFQTMRYMQGIGADINRQDHTTGRAVMHELVLNDCFTLLSKYILADLPGVDWLVQDREGRNFVQLAATFDARSTNATASICFSWETRWKSMVVPELVMHLPVMSSKQHVLSDIVLGYLVEDKETIQNEREEEEKEGPAAIMPTDLDDQLIALLAAQLDNAEEGV